MKGSSRIAVWLLVAALLGSGPASGWAKGYSSGGGRSYSSHSSSSGHSHSFSSGGGHSSSPGASHGPGSGSASGKSFNSGGGKSYGAGSTWSDSGRHSYNSSKSYSSGASHKSGPNQGTDLAAQPSKPAPGGPPRSDPSASPRFDFDSAAARARKEQASQQEFARFKDSQRTTPDSSPPAPRAPASVDPGVGQPATVVTPGGGWSRPRPYIPQPVVLSSRPARLRTIFEPYYWRPTVIYRDSYSSFFWWWLLDRSLEDRAWWAYHHRYDMDPVRYQALLATDQQLETRVTQLENQQAPRDPNFVPTGLDRDLMYSDQYVTRAYSNRPTALGTIAFWALGIPTAVAVCTFFIWLIWFKRWQTST